MPRKNTEIGLYEINKTFIIISLLQMFNIYIQMTIHLFNIRRGKGTWVNSFDVPQSGRGTSGSPRTLVKAVAHHRWKVSLKPPKYKC